MAAALDRLSRFDLPLRLSTFTRLYFAQPGQHRDRRAGRSDRGARHGNSATEAQIARVSQEPRYNAQLRTTCVATRLEGGHADNALPQRARATVNCRLMPREDPDFVQAELQRVAGDRVTVKAHGKVRVSDPSDPESPVMKTIQRVSESMWPGTPVMPVMSAGATDGSRLRNAGIPVYGVSGVFMEMGEVRIHGRDERVTVRAIDEGFEFMYRLARALASGE